MPSLCTSCNETPSFKALDEGVYEYSCGMKEPTCVALKGKNLMVLTRRWEQMYQGKGINKENFEIVQYADGFEAMDDFKRRGLL